MLDSVRSFIEIFIYTREREKGERQTDRWREKDPARQGGKINKYERKYKKKRGKRKIWRKKEVKR